MSRPRSRSVVAVGAISLADLSDSPGPSSRSPSPINASISLPESVDESSETEHSTTSDVNSNVTSSKRKNTLRSRVTAGAAAAAENVKIVVRIRPLSREEIERGDSIVWDVDENQIRCNVVEEESKEDSKTFVFDRIADASVDTHSIYDWEIRGIVKSFVSGVNGTIMAYGQTSSGKTYTMSGTNESPGINLLAIRDIFSGLAARGTSEPFTLTVSYYQIYNEEIFDLLNNNNGPLRIRQSSSAGVFIPDLRQVVINREEELLRTLAIGESLRNVASTAFNAASSRSHTILSLQLKFHDAEQKPVILKPIRRQSLRADAFKPSAAVPSTTTILNLVDLAGSERVDALDNQSVAGKNRMKEGQHINKSLYFLTMVVSRLALGTAAHVGFRDSKLTRILQPSLVGKSRTLVVCAISPALSNITESQSTLLFGSLAKKIEIDSSTNNQIAKKRSNVNQDVEINQLKGLIEELESENIAAAHRIRRDQELHRELTQSKKENEQLHRLIQVERERASSLANIVRQLMPSVTVQTDACDSLAQLAGEGMEQVSDGYRRFLREIPPEAREQVRAHTDVVIGALSRAQSLKKSAQIALGLQVRIEADGVTRKRLEQELLQKDAIIDKIQAKINVLQQRGLQLSGEYYWNRENSNREMLLQFEKSMLHRDLDQARKTNEQKKQDMRRLEWLIAMKERKTENAKRSAILMLEQSFIALEKSNQEYTKVLNILSTRDETFTNMSVQYEKLILKQLETANRGNNRQSKLTQSHCRSLQMYQSELCTRRSVEKLLRRERQVHFDEHNRIVQNFEQLLYDAGARENDLIKTNSEFQNKLEKLQCVNQQQGHALQSMQEALAKRTTIHDTSSVELKKQLAEYKRTIESLEKSNHELQTRLDDAITNQTMLLQQEVNRHIEERSVLVSKLEHALCTVECLEHESNNAKTALERMESQHQNVVEKLQGEVEQARNDQRAAVQRGAAIEAEAIDQKISTKHRVQHLERSCRDLEAELQHQRSVSNNIMSALRDEKSKIVQQMEDMHAVEIEQRNKLDAARTQCATLQAQVDETRERLEIESNRLKIADRECNDKRGVTLELQRELLECKRRYGILLANLDLKESISERIDYNQVNSLVSARIEDLRKQDINATALIEEKEGLRIQVKELQDIIASGQERVATEREERQKVRADLRVQRRANVDLAEANVEAKQRLDSLQHKIESLNLKLEEQHDNFSNTVKRLTKRISVYRSRARKLRIEKLETEAAGKQIKQQQRNLAHLEQKLSGAEEIHLETLHQLEFSRALLGFKRQTNISSSPDTEEELRTAASLVAVPSSSK